MRQLNSDEVYEKLMKIFNEREALYAQMEKENRHSGSNRISMSANAKSSGHPKNQSAGPAMRGHQLSSGQNQHQNVKVNPYSYNNMHGQQQSMQSIPMKNQNSTQFQQYVINQSSNQVQNSRNQAHKSGIGGRLNTKNNNAVGSSGMRQNTGSSFSNN